MTVRVNVTNTGRAGDEVVQLYVQHLGSAVARPARTFEASTDQLKPGERRTVAFSLRRRRWHTGIPIGMAGWSRPTRSGWSRGVVRGHPAEHHDQGPAMTTGHGYRPPRDTY